MIVDVDTYLAKMREKEEVKRLQQNISNIVPPVSISKLPPDKMIVPIELDIKLDNGVGGIVMIWDWFNWDLND